MKHSSQNLTDFIHASPAHLHPGGIILFTWASFNRVRPVRELLHQSPFEWREIREKHRSRTWYLFILNLPNSV